MVDSALFGSSQHFTMNELNSDAAVGDTCFGTALKNAHVLLTRTRCRRVNVQTGSINSNLDLSFCTEGHRLSFCKHLVIPYVNTKLRSKSKLIRSGS